VASEDLATALQTENTALKAGNGVSASLTGYLRDQINDTDRAVNYLQQNKDPKRVTIILGSCKSKADPVEAKCSLASGNSRPLPC
jgi:hypothetical protein